MAAVGDGTLTDQEGQFPQCHKKLFPELRMILG
jgi:hypothetical protein